MADEIERETARLFRVSRTAHELVRDRVSACLSSPLFRSNHYGHGLQAAPSRVSTGSGEAVRSLTV